MKTRKLKDLKENECIKVNTLKEAKYFINLIGWPIIPSELVGAFIFPKKGIQTNYSNLWDIGNYEGKQELPASEFIKPKKPKKWKEAFKEIARLDGEFQNIKLSMSEYFKSLNKTTSGIDTKKHSTDCRNLHVKDAEEVFSKTEITDLPEKWVVAVNENNSEVLTEWKKEISNNWFYTHAKKYDFISYRGEGLRVIPFEHTKISFSDFERLVLKKDAEQLKPLEVCRWYKCHEFEWLVYRSNLDGEGFGFNKGKWQDRMACTENTETVTWQLATNEEVESSLINELAKKGYKEGTLIKSFNNSEYTLSFVKPVFSPEFYNGNTDNFGIRMGGACIYANGIWAEIIEQPEEIDWSKSDGLIVESDDYIVIASGRYTSTHFEGTILKIKTKDFVTYNAKTGLLVKGISKIDFKPIKGEITLKNE